MNLFIISFFLGGGEFSDAGFWGGGLCVCGFFTILFCKLKLSRFSQFNPISISRVIPTGDKKALKSNRVLS